MKDSFFYMQRALDLAKEARDQGEVPVGAVVVYEDTIIGEGYNMSITLSDPTAHGEILALRQAGKKIGNYRLLNAFLYVTLEPCYMCTSAMVHARIRHCVFGARDPKSGALESIDHYFHRDHCNHKPSWEGNVLAEASSELLKDFFQARRVKKTPPIYPLTDMME